jgi:hypothetical protein
MSITKRALGERFNLSHNTVRDTLEACGLDTSRRDYTEEEIEQYFIPARKLIEEGASYKEVAEKFGGREARHEGSHPQEELLLGGEEVQESIRNEVLKDLQSVIRTALADAFDLIPQITAQEAVKMLREGYLRGAFEKYRAGYVRGEKVSIEMPSYRPVTGLFGGGVDSNGLAD